MPRRREVPKREILPDPKFGNVEVAKFMNVIMLAARSRLPSASYGAFDQIEKKAGKDPSKCSPLPSTTSSRWSK
jgi:small subunit ribosomal protein S7